MAQGRWIMRFGLTFGALLGVAPLAALVLVRHYSIPSSSNAPTLQVGDYVLARCYDSTCWTGRVPYLPVINWMEPRIGDLAVFHKPSDPGIDYIMRIVGVGGDEVQMKNGDLYLNGKAVATNLLQPAPTGDGDQEKMRQFEETLPNGVRYRVKRIFPENPLSNTAVFKVPPDNYFVLGDNRDNSSDSRDPNGGVGFVPRENMVGRAQWITFSKGNIGRSFTAIDLPSKPGP